MTVYVKDGGAWRTIDRVYVRDGTSFTNQTINNVYVKHSDEWRTVFVIFETPTTFTTGSTGSVAVPSLANAIHIKQAVGGGSGGYRGADYDKAGGESAGPGGASGSYISDMVFNVTGGETLTVNVGSGGAAGTGTYSGNSGPGGDTSISGSSSGALFALGGGGAVSVSGGGVQGPLRTNNPSTGGSRTITATPRSTGTTVDGLNITSFQSGPRGAFNQQGDGTAGANPGNCSGDNCTIGGGDGGDPYGGSVTTGGTGGANGNTAGTAGTQGGGGGGGGTEPGSSQGGAGGDGELIFRFLRIA